ncbi:hypothetical protein BJ508DRAFT_311189 [Ascobolus immersus RN42]|uniref:Uncharacterized protein n=1 Tax=Ascobolus immersus RN42 TaxID=1160509 RepID=A0A3N4HUR8_ASCIM|nr:hypothetical protein BJ508DRAFT_311189 [Ascobolus immersus RN42]
MPEIETIDMVDVEDSEDDQPMLRKSNRTTKFTAKQLEDPLPEWYNLNFDQDSDTIFIDTDLEDVDTFMAAVRKRVELAKKNLGKSKEFNKKIVMGDLKEKCKVLIELVVFGLKGESSGPMIIAVDRLSDAIAASKRELRIPLVFVDQWCLVIGVVIRPISFRSGTRVVSDDQFREVIIEFGI